MRKQTIQLSSSSSNTTTINDNNPPASKRINLFLPMMNSTLPNNNQGPPLSNGNNVNLNGNNGNTNGNTNGNGLGHMPEDVTATYTLQGVMQWLNGEYRRYERDRNTWEIERASLVVIFLKSKRMLMKAQVSHLMGTKVGAQKVQEDLLKQNRILERRIKALEMALKAERAKNSGKEIVDLPREKDSPSPAPSTTSQFENVNTDITPLLTHPDRQRSRKLLETCLREINYLMEQSSVPINHISKSDNPSFPIPMSQPTDKMLSNQSTEVSYVPVDHDQDKSAEEEELPRKLPRKPTLNDTPPLNIHKEDTNTWDFTPPPQEPPTTVLERQPVPRSSAKTLFKSSQPKLFTQIHTLRSHLSPVRALISCSSASILQDETCFISAGDDATIKFWRVSKSGSPQGKKKGNFDILPQITYRGHTGIITCLAESNGQFWSGGTDGGIRGWRVPPATRDAYGSSADASAMMVLDGHTNCIWGLAVPGTQQPLLASAAADRTVKIWDTRVNSRSPLRASFKYGNNEATRINPTCVDWDWDGRGVIIGWENAALELWDVEHGAATTTFVSTDSTDTGKSTQVNCFVKHPHENLLIAGYEDRNIRIFDARIGDCISSWTAHLDSISSLAISPDGTTLLSGAHDASVRFWDLSDKTCLQEALPPHRPRSDEGVLAVAWGEDDVAGSAGADGVIKLYVEQRQ